MSVIKARFLPSEIKQVNSFDFNDINHMQMLSAMGVHENVYTGDSQLPIGGGVTANISNLRTFLPGIVKNLTTVRKIDVLAGQTIIGDYKTDDEIVQMTQESVATVVGYSDDVNIPFSSFNMGYEKRDIVRFVAGTKSQLIADAKIQKSGGDPVASRLSAAVEGLEIMRNKVGFYGVDGQKTYGILNEPNLPAYESLPNGANATPQWSTKTFLEKQLDVVNAITSLQLSTGGNFDPTMSNFTFAVSLAAAGTLTNVNEFGISIQKWINDTYPRCRIEFVPQFDNANNSLNVFYMYVDSMQGDSTDNGNTIENLLSQKIVSIGQSQEIGGVKEGFMSAMYGVIVKRPYAIYRARGI
jgi:hypothetical protein